MTRLTTKGEPMWLARWDRRRKPEWQRKRRNTAQRVKALHARTHKAARLIRERREQAFALQLGCECVECQALPGFVPKGAR